MAIKKYNPTSPGRRGMSVSAFEEITTTTPEKSLLAPLKKTGGRNMHGRITVRHIGGGNKRKYRIIDFKRNKDGVPAKVATIEYDPNRTANIAPAPLCDGEKRYILAPLGLQVGTWFFPEKRQILSRATHWKSKISCGHHDSQYRDEAGQGWPAGEKRRQCGAAHGKGRQLCPGQTPLWRGSHDSHER